MMLQWVLLILLITAVQKTIAASSAAQELLPMCVLQAMTTATSSHFFESVQNLVVLFHTNEPNLHSCL